MSNNTFTFIALVTHWGSRYGGVNAFNADFLEAMGSAYIGDIRVICVSAEAQQVDIDDAKRKNVILIPLPYEPSTSHLKREQAQAAIDAIRKQKIAFQPKHTLWLGHDRISGEAAVVAAQLTGGRSALIHHMSYDHYEAFAENAQTAKDKLSEQKSLFEQANVVMAVGPMLRDALRDMVDGDVHMIIPGLADIAPKKKAPNTFSMFVSGRLNADALKIKQGQLAVAAFAQCYKQANQQGQPASLLKRPKLLMRGVDFELEAQDTHYSSSEQNLKKFAEGYAAAVINLQPLPYTTNRKDLFDELKNSSVAAMPSWHEGFGLVAWEAIAAGVPLILSKNSGVYELLVENHGGFETGHVWPVQVGGQVDDPYFSDTDLETVRSKIMEIAIDPQKARDKALRLREELSQYTWTRCAEQVLEFLGWDIAQTESDNQKAEAQSTTAPNPVSQSSGQSTPLVAGKPVALNSGVVLENKYQILATLGQGGFGVTYLVEDINLKKQYVIKELLPWGYVADTRLGENVQPLPGTAPSFDYFKHSFLREAQTIIKVHDDAVVRVLAFFEQNNTAYYVMDYVEGEDLKRIVDARGCLSQGKIINILRPLLQGVKKLHDVDIIHRDIKPDNVFLRTDEKALLIDFGAARNVKDQENYPFTRIYSAGFAPIEQHNGEHQGPWTDIYALGALIYFLMTGEKLASAPNRLESNADVFADFTEKKAFSRSWLDAVNHALQIEADDRPQSIEAWERRLFAKRSWLKIAVIAIPLLLISTYIIQKPKLGDTWVQPETGMSFVWIEPDSFSMGSPGNELGRAENESLHPVSLTNGFWIGQYEVTQKQWELITGTLPERISSCGENCPARNSWQAVSNAIAQLNQTSRFDYRLPTEAEWEYVARAGEKAATYNGDLQLDSESRFETDRLNTIAWHRGNSYTIKPHGTPCDGVNGQTCGLQSVGQKESNAWQVYDILGNEWEWVSDFYAAYRTEKQLDPPGPESGRERVIRGCGWRSKANLCRAAQRSHKDPANAFYAFRLVREE